MKKRNIIIGSVVISIIIIVGVVVALLLNKKDDKTPKIVKAGYLDYEFEEGSDFAYSPNLEKLDKQDTDNDGLSDLREEYLGTDKEKYDTDEDGLSDGDEIKYGTDPLKKDEKCNGKYELKQETKTEKVNLIVNAKSENPNAVRVTNIGETGILAQNSVPGMVGNAYDFSLIDGELESATVTFEITDSKFDSKEKYSVYYFNEKDVTFDRVEEQKQEGNKITAELEHFSKYVVIKDLSLAQAENYMREKVNTSIEKDPNKDTDGDGFMDDEDKTPYIADEYKDIYHFARQVYKGKDVLFILAYQPVDKSPAVIGWLDGGNTGHTFLAYYDSSEDEIYYYGVRSYDPEEKYDSSFFLTGQSCDAKVCVPGGYYVTNSLLAKSVFVEEADSPRGTEEYAPFTDALPIVVNESTLDKLNQFCENYDYQYNLYTSNCTTFALRFLNSLDLNYDIYQYTSWKRPLTVAFAYAGSPGQVAYCMESFYPDIAISNVVETYVKDGEKYGINVACRSKYSSRLALNVSFQANDPFEYVPILENTKEEGALKVGNHTLKYGNYESTAGLMEPGSYGTITLKPNGKFHIKSNYDEEGGTTERVERDCDGTYEVQLNQPTGYPDDYADYIKFTPEQGNGFYFQVYQDNSFSDQWHFYNYTENNSTITENSANNANSTKTSTANVPSDIDDVYKDYVKNKEYEKYTEEWEVKPNGYCMLDINQDGQKELIIIGDTDLGWHYVQINTYDKSIKKVVEVENTFVYAGLEYSKATKQLVYTNVKPFQGAMGYAFYEMKNNKLERVKSVGSDDIDSYFIQLNGQELKHITKDECSAQFDGFEYLEYSKL